MGPGAYVTQPELGAGVAERVRHVRRSVVGHDALIIDAALPIVLDHAMQQGDHSLLAFIFGDDGERRARVIVDRHVHVLSIDAAMAVLASTRDRVPRRADPAEHFPVEVAELARMRPLVAAGRGLGLQLAPAAHAGAAQHPRDRCP